MTDGAHKPWLSREVSVQWVIGLALAFAAWSHNERVRAASEMAQLRSSVDQRPGLIERSDREQDRLQECLQRQMDLLKGCMR